MRRLYVGGLMCLSTLVLLLLARDASAVSGPSTFSYEGRLYDSAGNASAQTVTLKVSIYDPNGTCLLREETTTPINLADSDGYFSITIGTNTATGLALAAALSNAGPLTGISSCSYTPVVGDSRKIRVSVSDGSAYVAMQPDLSIGTSPYAMSADTVQGLGPLQLIQVNTTAGKVLTQANVESVFANPANLTNLNSLIAGTSTQYVKSSANGAVVPSYTGNPSTPTSGQMWFDSTASQLKYYNGTTVQTVGAGGGGSVTSVTGTAPVTVGGTSAAPVVSMAAATSSVNGYLSSSDWTTFNNKLSNSLVDGKVLIGNASNVATPQMISGDIAISNTGVVAVNKIQNVAISGGAPGVAGQVLRYNGSSAYVPALLAVSDITNLSSQLASKIDASNMPANCSAGQTLSFSSPSGTWNCMNLPASILQAGGTSLGSQLMIGTNDSFDMHLVTNATPRVTIMQDGKFGLGTTAPIAPFHMKMSGSADMMVSAESGAAQLLLAGPGSGSYPGVAMSYLGNGLQIGKVTNGSANVSNPWAKINGTAGTFEFTAITGSSVEAKMSLQKGNSLTAVAANSPLARIGFDGYNGTGYSSSAAAVQGMAAENFSPSYNGAHLLFLTTANGSLSPQERMRIEHSGQVGIGVGQPRAMLDVAGAILSAPPNPIGGAIVDFKMGNIQYTTSSCQAFQLHNLKSGGEYNFIVQGTTSTTCSFTAFSDVGTTALNVHMPPSHGVTTASKHTRYNIVVAGTEAYLTWTPGL